MIKKINKTIWLVLLGLFLLIASYFAYAFYVNYTSAGMPVQSSNNEANKGF